ncbi:NAD(P)H-binding protein [Agaribacterium sp. ZY112]|uniref:NAD(P)H-binding protein n=1 Tax=Agaribacterium sp. ZY112 TaxID=3233574 RepID=UPI0035262468
MKVAITSANGQLGSAIVKAAIGLLGKDNVVGLARTPAKAKHLGIDVFAGDYNNAKALENSLISAKVDAVLLISGMDAPDKRIDQHRNVIEAAKKAGVSKIVYTSIQGAEEGTAFSAVVQSNRQTEDDVKNSGLNWVIGRNGIYIEPDLEYIDNYKKLGMITNCAGDGKCAYTTRDELAFAYAKLLCEDKHNSRTYNLQGDAISQYQLADYLNQAFDLKLSYQAVSVEAYRQDRIDELGEFLGTVIAGIYEGIRKGENDRPSDYLQAAGRQHQSWDSFFSEQKIN